MIMILQNQIENIRLSRASFIRTLAFFDLDYKEATAALYKKQKFCACRAEFCVKAVRTAKAYFFDHQWIYFVS